MSECRVQQRLISYLVNHGYDIVSENNTEIPDVVAKRRGKAFFFEVKSKMFTVDNTIGQCLRQVANTRMSGYTLKCTKYFNVGSKRVLEKVEVPPIHEVGLVVPVESGSWYLRKLQIIEKTITALNLPIKLIIGTGEGLETAMRVLRPTDIMIKRIEGDEQFLNYKAAKMDELIERRFRTPPNIYREELQKKLPYLPLRPEIVLSDELKPFAEVLNSSRFK